jgi:hypothetical protein
MLVDIAMFSLMGLAIAYVIRRMGDGAPFTLVACAAALLTVVGLSVALAALGGRFDQTYESAVARFVASLAGAFFGVLLASRQRSLIAGGGDLPIWVGDRSAGPVLAAALVIGVALIELNQTGIISFESPKAAMGGMRMREVSPGNPISVAGPAPVNPTNAARTRIETDTRAAKAGKTSALETSANVVAMTSPRQTAGASDASVQNRSSEIKVDSNADNAGKAGTAAPKAAEALDAGAGEKTASEESNANQDQEKSVAVNAVPAPTQGLMGNARACANWAQFAKLVQNCVALPCQACRGQEEMRHALKDRNVAGFSHGFYDCYWPDRDKVEFGNRCIGADNERAMTYARYFLRNPNASNPAQP